MPERVPDLRSAVVDFSLLLTRGYAEKSALKLVGDRFGLTRRQRLAVLRSSCSDQQLASRSERRLDISQIAGRSLAIDGYNILITIEAAMSSGVIFIGRDGACRDLASIHGTYRKVAETIPALELIGEFLVETDVQKAGWLLDSPVSNSGRLKALIDNIARGSGRPWDVELAANPDALLIETGSVVASSDGMVLDRCGSWVNLARAVIERKIPGAGIIDLSKI